MGLKPGVYLYKAKIVDFWGQPYFDFTLIFQVRSNEGDRYEKHCIEKENREKYYKKFENVKLTHPINFFYHARSSLNTRGLISKLTDEELTESSWNHRLS